MAYQSALDNSWEPKKLSRVSTEKLSDLFVKLDRELKHGVSRKMILNVLVKMKAIESDAESQEFLKLKGSSRDDETVRNSITLKEFLITIENKACKNSAKELYFVDEFIDLFLDEKMAVK